MISAISASSSSSDSAHRRRNSALSVSRMRMPCFFSVYSSTGRPLRSMPIGKYTLRPRMRAVRAIMSIWE